MSACLVNLEHMLQQFRHFGKRNSLENLPANLPRPRHGRRQIRCRNLHGRAGGVHLHALQADIADVMLREGIRAAGQMNIDGLIQLQALVKVRGAAAGPPPVAPALGDSALARQAIEPRLARRFACQRFGQLRAARRYMKTGGKPLVAEKKPVSAFGAGRATFLQLTRLCKQFRSATPRCV